MRKKLKEKSDKMDAGKLNNIYEVDEILGSEIKNKKKIYLVKWKNYSIEEATWYFFRIYFWSFKIVIIKGSLRKIFPKN